jgi:TetR/AcrR family transcriptional regulator
MPKLATARTPAVAKVARPRAQQRADTRHAVLNAAIELFASRGFDGTALPAIAAASGIQVPLIIYHFKNKDTLWRAAVDEVFARVHAHLGEHRAGIEAANGLQYYRRCARAHLTALARYPEYMRIVFQEGTQSSERLQWLVKTHQGPMTDMLKAIIARAQGEGLVPAMNLDEAKFIFSGAFSLSIVLGPEYALVTGEDSRTDAFIERHLDSCLRLLLPSIDWSDPVTH